MSDLVSDGVLELLNRERIKLWAEKMREKGLKDVGYNEIIKVLVKAQVDRLSGGRDSLYSAGLTVTHLNLAEPVPLPDILAHPVLIESPQHIPLDYIAI